MPPGRGEEKRKCDFSTADLENSSLPPPSPIGALCSLFSNCFRGLLSSFLQQGERRRKKNAQTKKKERARDVSYVCFSYYTLYFSISLSLSLLSVHVLQPRAYFKHTTRGGQIARLRLQCRARGGKPVVRSCGLKARVPRISFFRFRNIVCTQPAVGRPTFTPVSSASFLVRLSASPLSPACDVVCSWSKTPILANCLHQVVSTNFVIEFLLC